MINQLGHKLFPIIPDDQLQNSSQLPSLLVMASPAGELDRAGWIQVFV